MVVGLYGAEEKTGGGAGGGRREPTFLYTLHQQNIKHFILFLTTWDCASGIPGSTVWQLVDFVRFLHLLLSYYFGFGKNVSHGIPYVFCSFPNFYLATGTQLRHSLQNMAVNCEPEQSKWVNMSQQTGEDSKQGINHF